LISRVFSISERCFMIARLFSYRRLFQLLEVVRPRK
jgi:hypothetical protein